MHAVLGAWYTGMHGRLVGVVNITTVTTKAIHSIFKSLQRKPQARLYVGWLASVMLAHGSECLKYK